MTKKKPQRGRNVLYIIMQKWKDVLQANALLPALAFPGTEIFIFERIRNAAGFGKSVYCRIKVGVVYSPTDHHDSPSYCINK